MVMSVVCVYDMKWYLRSWRPLYRRKLAPEQVKTFGFHKKHSADDITGLLRECLVKASAWGRDIFVASMDVLRA